MKERSYALDVFLVCAGTLLELFLAVHCPNSVSGVPGRSWKIALEQGQAEDGSQQAVSMYSCSSFPSFSLLEVKRA